MSLVSGLLARHKHSTQVHAVCLLVCRANLTPSSRACVAFALSLLSDAAEEVAVDVTASSVVKVRNLTSNDREALVEFARVSL